MHYHNHKFSRFSIPFPSLCGDFYLAKRAQMRLMPLYQADVVQSMEEMLNG